MSTKTQLRVWHIPQVPGKPFHVDVASVEEAVKIMDVLADYDAFQFQHNIKPDYCNSQGLVMMEDGEWVDWYYEGDADLHGYFDDPREYVKQLISK